MTPYDIFYKEFGSSRNFMTPNHIEYGFIVNNIMAYEISKGTGITNNIIFGFTVVRLYPNGRTKRLKNPVSKLFYRFSDAKKHRDRLIGRFNK